MASRSGTTPATIRRRRASPPAPLPPRPSARQFALVGTSARASAGRLPQIDPAVRPSLSGEAQWRPGRVGRLGRPATYTTWFRPDVHHPTLVAGVLWIDPAQSRLDLVAGTQEPGGGPWPGRAEVGLRDRATTVAAFNSGFLMSGAHGGFYQDGRYAGPLRTNQASVVIMRDGRATVGEWQRDVRFSPAVSSVRQNLALIVDHGRAVNGLTKNTNFVWGSRKSQLEYVWRSGLGVDAHGHLIYIAGDKFTLTTLAAAFVQAHAVRAMELDIHHDMVTANLFCRPLARPAGSTQPSSFRP